MAYVGVIPDLVFYKAFKVASHLYESSLKLQRYGTKMLQYSGDVASSEYEELRDLAQSIFTNIAWEDLSSRPSSYVDHESGIKQYAIFLHDTFARDGHFLLNDAHGDHALSDEKRNDGVVLLNMFVTRVSQFKRLLDEMLEFDQASKPTEYQAKMNEAKMLYDHTNLVGDHPASAHQLVEQNTGIMQLIVALDYYFGHGIFYSS